MAITFATIATKIAELAEVTAGNSVTMDNTIPNGLRAALETAGLTANRASFEGLKSLTTNIVLTTNTGLINKAINAKIINTSFSFQFLIMLDQVAIEGDMEEQFKLIRKGEFDFGDNETHPFSIWKLERVWIN